MTTDIRMDGIFSPSKSPKINLFKNPPFFIHIIYNIIYNFLNSIIYLLFVSLRYN